MDFAFVGRVNLAFSLLLTEDHFWHSHFCPKFGTVIIYKTIWNTIIMYKN